MGERWPLRLDFWNLLSVTLNRQQARCTLLLETMDVETRLLGDVEQWAYTNNVSEQGEGCDNCVWKEILQRGSSGFSPDDNIFDNNNSERKSYHVAVVFSVNCIGDVRVSIIFFFFCSFWKKQKRFQLWWDGGDSGFIVQYDITFTF